MLGTAHILGKREERRKAFAKFSPKFDCRSAAFHGRTGKLTHRAVSELGASLGVPVTQGRDSGGAGAGGAVVAPSATPVSRLDAGIAVDPAMARAAWRQLVACGAIGAALRRVE